MINILYIHQFGDGGGGGDESMLALVRRLDRTLYSPIVVATTYGPVVDKFRDFGIELITMPKANARLLAKAIILFCYIKIVNIILSRRINIVHLNHQEEKIFIVLICKILKIPCVYHVRSLLLINKMGYIKRFLINLMDKKIVVSNAVKQRMIEKKIKDRNIVVIYNGVDLEEFDSQVEVDSTIIEKYEISSKHILIGMVGRIVPWKGYDDYILAAKEVTTVIPESRFMIVGSYDESDSYITKLKKIILDLELKDKVIFIGYQYNIVPIYRSLSLLVLASWEEPLSRTCFEAMALRKPVIATNTGGTPEVIYDRINGLLVPPHNSNALANAIISILKDKELAKKLGLAGRKIVEQKFLISNHVRQVQDLYVELVT